MWDGFHSVALIAHTERRASSWLPTTYEDVAAMARDIEHFSSVGISVIPPVIDPDVQPGPGADCSPTESRRSRPTRRFTRGLADCCCRGSLIPGCRATRTRPGRYVANCSPSSRGSD